MISFIWSKVDSSLKHVGQNVGHQKYLEETYGKRVRVSFPSLWVSVEENVVVRRCQNRKQLFLSPGIGLQG